MKEAVKGKEKLLTIISAAVLVFGLLLAFYYIFTREIVTFNIDYTDSLFWAAASCESNSLINYDYWYVYIIVLPGSNCLV